MANWFSRMFLGSVVIGSLSGSAAQAADNSHSDVRTDPVEIPADVRKGLSHIRIFKNVIPIDRDTPLPGSWNGGGHNQEIKAHYDHSHRRVVCQTYSVSDQIAYLRARHHDNQLPRNDFTAALQEFQQMLKAVKYPGPLPESLEEVQNVLSSAETVLSKKNMQNVRRTAFETGLEAAADFLRSIDNINSENTSSHVVTHELEHGQTALIKEKALLPSSLLSPQDYLLFSMADELNSFCKEGQITGKKPQQVIDEFRQIHQGGYLQRNSEAIFDSHSYWNSETYKHAYAQNLDLKNASQITATTPVIFGETFTANLNGQSYAVSKCIRESDQSFCYTVMEDGERQRLPDESIVTAPNGKKYEANVLYASNGKPLTDRQGHKSGGYGYWDEQDGWSLKLAESRMQAQDNFSRRNFEKLMTEKFGEKSPDNTLRSLIEAELEQYRQSRDYQKLSSMYTTETIAPAYAADCKTTPLTDDYVRAGDRFRAKTNDNTANLVDITDNYTKQRVISKHIDYARTVLSDKNTNQEMVQSQQTPPSRGDYSQFIETYKQLEQQRK